MNDSQIGLIIGMGSVAGIVIAVLAFIVIKQKQKINYLTTPKYGFMGKTLAVGVFMLIGITALVSVYTYPFAKQPTTISVTDKTDVVIELNYQIQDQTTNLYYINAIPVIDKKDWGNSASIKMNVSWQINTQTELIERSENNLSINRPGGILENLAPGINSIHVIVEINGLLFEKSVIIQI